MADLDLKDALQMFQQGTKDLMFTRALNDANDQVSQIKASEQDETKQRGALQQVANNLTMHMAQYGVPATTMEAVRAAVAPHTFKNADEMAAYGISNGKSGIVDDAQQLKEFEDQDKIRLAQINKGYLNLARQQKADDKLNTDFIKDSKGVNDKIDPNTTRFGNISKLQGVNNQIQDAQALLQDPKNWTPQALIETTRKLDAVLSNGAATVAGSEHLTPKIRASYEANLQQMISNKPTPMQGADEYRKYYQDLFSRIQGVNKNIIQEGQLSYLSGSVPSMIAKYKGKIPDMEAAFSEKLGEPVQIDPKTRSIDTVANIDKQNMYEQVMKEAAALPANDPKAQAAMGMITSDDRNLRKLLVRSSSARLLMKRLQK